MPTQVQNAILQRVREVPGIPFAALAHDGSGVRPNDVYTMLAVSLLYAAPLIPYGRVRLYLDVEQARAYAYQSPARLTSRVGSPLPEVTTPLATNTSLLWDGRCFTLVNLGGTTTTLLPEKELPIQVPSAFFFQLFDTGVIRRLRLQKDLPALSREVDLLMDHASPSDLRQANGCFEKVVAYLQG